MRHLGPAEPHSIRADPNLRRHIAEAVGSAPRAVGGACGRNPIPIIIPCHRVVGRSGKLGGFSAFAGLETKKTLLRLEGCAVT